MSASVLQERIQGVERGEATDIEQGEEAIPS